LLPGVIQIIDLYHAKGTISRVAKEIFGTDSEFGKKWRKLLYCSRAIDIILEKLKPYLEESSFHGDSRPLKYGCL